MTITVKNSDGDVIASGMLTIDYTTTPPSGTFTPAGGTAIACNQVSFAKPDQSGTTNFNFRVSGQANGSFPLGNNGTPYTYNFVGSKNANSPASGTVNFPSENSSSNWPDDDNDTWQATATVGEGKKVEKKKKSTYAS